MTLLQEMSFSHVSLSEVADVTTILSPQRKWSEVPDILIINPAMVGLFSINQLRSDLGNENLQLIALQSSAVDQSTTNNYDAVISLYDSAAEIKDKISQLLTKDSEEEGPRKDELTQREREIIVCVVKGMTNKQIADELFISAHTVIAHRRNISSKLQIHSPSGLTIYAIVNKLVDLSDIQEGITSRS